METDGFWDIIVTSLQDVYNANGSLAFAAIKPDDISSMLTEELERLREEIMDHKANLGTAGRLVDTCLQNLQTLLSQLQQKEKPRPTGKGAPPSGKYHHEGSSSSAGKVYKRETGGKSKIKSKSKKEGRLFWTSKYNPLEPIVVGSEVAYKLRSRHFEEWIQCEVIKVIGDGIKFDIRDPEPDENNNPGQTFRASYKEILLIPDPSDVPQLTNYVYGNKVLARYPETTTFYPALVVGNKKDGNVRLKFYGEEEVNKETEVERRLVLPFPEK
ncbi:SAGA HAT/Core module component [Scheffersomyces spartinae]|uniref:SAGA HAT/Core module component n=1 Tax=Scheffersomyces spartinae TaxID=45513 RepID=A0A9P7VAV0_9ASCO|nr:SAGA HAT/Core module component [Scheffersomyces spartinae]KAG7194004.1 SAGA HAT/Core module component [Scheffersomyces spartinae]